MRPDAACAIALAGCAALGYAHERGVLHRDIKPDNMMFSEPGVLKVTDFGIAKILAGTNSRATRTGDLLGTVAYMAPEQATGGDLGPPTDVYALGIVLYEVLSNGRLPHGESDNLVAMLLKRASEDAIPLAEVAPGTPPPLAAAVDRALARDPARRWPTAAAFAAALTQASGATFGAGWLGRTGVGVFGRSARDDEGPPPPPPPPPPPRPAAPSPPAPTPPTPPRPEAPTPGPVSSIGSQSLPSGVTSSVSPEMPSPSRSPSTPPSPISRAVVRGATSAPPAAMPAPVPTTPPPRRSLRRRRLFQARRHQAPNLLGPILDGATRRSWSTNTSSRSTDGSG